MARPRINEDEIRLKLIEEAERALAESKGRRLVLSDLARRIGISQSYAHRFFPTKADLVRALAQRWFDEVERLSCEVVTRKSPAPERLKAWIVEILRLKRARFDENPALFCAYLELAGKHMDLVQRHGRHLQADLERIVSDLLPAGRVALAMPLILDATLLFRMPHTIARHRQQATDERAEAVVEMLLAQLQ